MKAKEMLEPCVRWNRALHGTSKGVATTAAARGAEAGSSNAQANLPPSEQLFLDEHPSCASLFTNLEKLLGRLREPPL